MCSEIEIAVFKKSNVVFEFDKKPEANVDIFNNKLFNQCNKILSKRLAMIDVTT